MLFAQIIGTIAFSISGAIIGIENKCDIFGILSLGFVTSFGGGIFRDMILGIHPSSILYNGVFINTSIITSMIVYLLYKNISKFNINKKVLHSSLNLIDAIGLGIFTVVACSMVLDYNYTIYLMMFMPFITACGGGICRDVFVRKIPVVFLTDVYALTTILGGINFYILICYNVSELVVFIITFSIVFFLRVIFIIIPIKQLSIKKLNKL